MPFIELFARIDAVDAATIKETAKHFIVNKVTVNQRYYNDELCR